MQVYIVLHGVHYEGSQIKEVFNDLASANNYILTEGVDYLTKYYSYSDEEINIESHYDDSGYFQVSYRDSSFYIQSWEVK